MTRYQKRLNWRPLGNEVAFRKVLAHEAAFREALAQKYPQISTHSGRLLKEILHGHDYQNRFWSAHYFSMNRYRRGLKQIVRLVIRLDGLIGNVEDDERHGVWQLINALCIAIGNMDTVSSHRALVSFLDESCSSSLTSSALEAMAFEKEHFDPLVVLERLLNSKSDSDLLSALYAAEFQSIARSHPNIVSRIEALTTHSYPLIRCQAVGALACTGGSHVAISMLLDDPVPFVRKAAQHALRVAHSVNSEE